MDLSRRQALAAAGSAAFLSASVFANTTNKNTQTRKWDMSYDVVVAGGGAAGIMAAIKAAKAGAKVLLLQAAVVLGGNSAISSGWIRSVNTKWHAKKESKTQLKLTATIFSNTVAVPAIPKRPTSLLAAVTNLSIF